MLQLERLDEGTQTRIKRVAARLSQHDLASRAGIDRRRLSEHERGERPLRGAELARLHDALERATPQAKESLFGALAS
jgi:transcriptional regulator with XRE-family HTH domain